MKDVLMCILPENNPIFDDIRVREAFMLSVDWDKVAETVYGALCIKATSTLPHDVYFYANIGQFEFNQDRARELLAEAGYADQRIQLRHICTTGFDVVAEAIQASIKETGFDMTIECYDPPTGVPMLRDGLSDFITKQSMSGAYTLDPDMVYDTLSPDSTLPPARQSSAEWTALFYQGLYSVDNAARAAAYAGLQQYLKDQYRAAGICERALMLVWNSNRIAEFPLIVSDEPVVTLIKFR